MIINEGGDLPKERIETVRMINGKELKELPLSMFTLFSDRIFTDFGRTLPALLHRGLTVEEAFVILTNCPSYIKPEDDTTRVNSELLLKSMLVVRKQVREEQTRQQALIDKAYDIDLIEEGISAVVNPVTVLYQSRHKETNECCVDFGQWSDWKTITKPQYEDTLVYISWGQTYEVRRLGVIEEKSISNQINIEFDSDEFIAEVDRPGFAWDNLSPAEQRNLLGSTEGFLADQVSKFKLSVESLFESIRRGDQAYQEWLKNAIVAHFNDEPIPEYVAGINKIQVELAEDEPYFVLRGRDPQAPDLIETWAADRVLCEPGTGKAESAYVVADAMREFKKHNANLGMDAEVYSKLMQKDVSKLRAWTETLVKAIRICHERSYSGDASTLTDIKDYLIENESVQPRVKNHFPPNP